MNERSKEYRIYVSCLIARMNDDIEKLKKQGVNIVDHNNRMQRLNIIIQEQDGEAYFRTEAVR